MDDGTIEVEFQFQIDSVREAKGSWENYYIPGDYAIVSKKMTIKGSSYNYTAMTKKAGQQSWPIDMPSVIFATGTDSIRPQMDLTALNPLEAALLQIGFGAPFSFERLNSLSSINYSRQLGLTKHLMTTPFQNLP